jgi:protein-tyrosine phosphatase
MHFIDIHSHLLAGWDDGAESWDVALEMLRQGEADGIKEVICTPHILSRGDIERESQVLSLYKTLLQKARAAGLTMKIHIGSELYIQPDLSLDRHIATLAQNGRYFLVEFSMGMIPDFVAKRFFELMTEDKIPIIAHPERYAGILNKPQKAFDFVEKGALLQINAGSVLGIFGGKVKIITRQLMDADVVHFIATDAHDLDKRPLKLRDAYEAVASGWGEERAHRLFYENPRRVIRGEYIDSGEPRLDPSQLKPSLRERLSSYISKMK